MLDFIKKDSQAKNEVPNDGTIKNESTTNKVGVGIATSLMGAVIFVPIGIVLVIIGVFLTLTLIGAIIGIPMILFGIVLAVVGPFGGLTALGMKKAKCPYCENIVYVNSKKSVTCQVCKKLSIVKDGKLQLVV